MEYIAKTKYLVPLFILGMLFPSLLFARQTQDLEKQYEQAKTDSAKVILLNRLALSAAGEGKTEASLKYAGQAADLSRSANFAYGIGLTDLTYGKLYRRRGDNSKAQDAYFQSLIFFEERKDFGKLSENYYEMGLLYNNWGNYPKASEYLSRCAVLSDSIGMKKTALSAKEFNADALAGNLEYTKARQEYVVAAEAYRKAGDEKSLARVLGKLSLTSALDGDHEKAVQLSEEKFKLNEKNGELDEAGLAANNIGYFYRQKDRNTEADAYFRKALDFYQKSNNTNQKVTVLNNLGVTAARASDLTKAGRYFSEALNLNLASGDKFRQAESYNYMAANEFVAGKNETALSAALRAEAIAKEVGAEEHLAETYRILSEIYASENDFRPAREAEQNYAAIRAKIDKREQDRKAALQESILEAEQKESQFRQMAADRARRQIETDRAKAEASGAKAQLEVERQKSVSLENQKELERSRANNSRLQREQAENVAALLQQRLTAEKREREISELERDKEQKEYALLQKEAEDNERKKDLELLRKDNEFKEQQRAEEEKSKFLSYGVLVLALLALLFALYGMITKQKANKKLNTQQQEISKKNEELLAGEEELRQNMEELQATQEAMIHKQKEVEKANAKLLNSEVVLRKALSKTKQKEVEVRDKNNQLLLSQQELQNSMEEINATKEVLEQQRNELDVKNQKVTQSIRYAQQIQSSILPSLAKQNALFPASFTIYKPKDIVSGDFYWMSEHKDCKLIAVIDCTGHGVPGAFMSLIGNNILNETINQHFITDPAEILRLQHIGVRQKLDQDEGGNNDGMDMGMCRLERLSETETRLTFAGAKNKLYCIKDGNLEIIRGDRKSIGGARSAIDLQFENHEIILKKGDSFFMLTDGYTDQAGEDRRSFGSPRFESVLKESQTKSIKDISALLEQNLAKHQGKAEQRDDITLIGVKL